MGLEVRLDTKGRIKVFEGVSGRIEYYSDGQVKSIGGVRVEYHGDGSVKSIGGRRIEYYGNGYVKSVGQGKVKISIETYDGDTLVPKSARARHS